MTKHNKIGKVTLDLPDSPYEEGGPVASEKTLVRIGVKTK